MKLSAKEKAIVKDFSVVLKKYKHLGPLKLATLLRKAFDGYEAHPKIRRV